MLTAAALALLAPVAIVNAAPAGDLSSRQDVTRFESWIIRTDGATFPYYTKDAK